MPGCDPRSSIQPGIARPVNRGYGQLTVTGGKCAGSWQSTQLGLHRTLGLLHQRTPGRPGFWPLPSLRSRFLLFPAQVSPQEQERDLSGGEETASVAARGQFEKRLSGSSREWKQATFAIQNLRDENQNCFPPRK